jgi:small subunit ribosomal protein S1
VFENRQVNEIVHGQVTKLVSFGAFVEIEEGVEGLIHISELAQHHVEDPSEIVRPGQDVNVKIIEIDPERRRLSLSLKRLEPEYRIHEDVLAEEGEEEQEGEEAEAVAEVDEGAGPVGEAEVPAAPAEGQAAETEDVAEEPKGAQPESETTRELEAPAPETSGSPVSEAGEMTEAEAESDQAAEKEPEPAAAESESEAVDEADKEG